MRDFGSLPPNCNPFVVVWDKAVDDETLPNLAPEYFWYDSAADLPMSDPNPATPALSQKEAEDLVRKLVAGDPKVNFAVKLDNFDIIPEDLLNVVRLVEEKDIYRDGTGCREKHCYYAVCLGRLRMHSFEPWTWRKDKSTYFRECSLLGCSYSETCDELIPTGQIALLGAAAQHGHEWSHWRCTADQCGLFEPPYLYERRCSKCKVVQKAEDLEKKPPQ